MEERRRRNDVEVMHRQLRFEPGVTRYFANAEWEKLVRTGVYWLETEIE
jgi:hypothetical protein